jgi:hypothetical protein
MAISTMQNQPTGYELMLAPKMFAFSPTRCDINVIWDTSIREGKFLKDFYTKICQHVVSTWTFVNRNQVIRKLPPFTEVTDVAMAQMEPFLPFMMSVELCRDIIQQWKVDGQNGTFLNELIWSTLLIDEPAPDDKRKYQDYFYFTIVYHLKGIEVSLNEYATIYNGYAGFITRCINTGILTREEVPDAFPHPSENTQSEQLTVPPPRTSQEIPNSYISSSSSSVISGEQHLLGKRDAPLDDDYNFYVEREDMPRNENIAPESCSLHDFENGHSFPPLHDHPSKRSNVGSTQSDLFSDKIPFEHDLDWDPNYSLESSLNPLSPLPDFFGNDNMSDSTAPSFFRNAEQQNNLCSPMLTSAAPPPFNTPNLMSQPNITPYHRPYDHLSSSRPVTPAANLDLSFSANTPMNGHRIRRTNELATKLLNGTAETVAANQLLMNQIKLQQQQINSMRRQMLSLHYKAAVAFADTETRATKAVENGARIGTAISYGATDFLQYVRAGIETVLTDASEGENNGRIVSRLGAILDTCDTFLANTDATREQVASSGGEEGRKIQSMYESAYRAWNHQRNPVLARLYDIGSQPAHAIGNQIPQQPTNTVPSELFLTHHPTEDITD